MIQEKGLRRYAVIEYLAAGPATREQLHSSLLLHHDGKPITRQSFDETMKLLINNQYVRKLKYATGMRKKLEVYVLGEAAVGEICCQEGIEPEYIECRMLPPIGRHLAHELQLSDIIRKIRLDAKNGHYDLLDYYDDKIMKRIVRMRQGKIPMDFYLPDLYIRAFRYGKCIEYYLEFTNIGKSLNYFTKKIKHWDRPSLLIFKDKKRRERVEEHLKNSDLKCLDFKCIDLESFLRDGFFKFIE